MDDIGEELRKIRESDQPTVDVLFGILYADIERAIRRKLGSRRNLPIDPTELVNEAYLKMRKRRGVEWQDRGHFVRAAAQAAMHALGDHARRLQAGKRGGGAKMTTLVTFIPAESPVPIEDMIGIEEAFEKLLQRYPRQADVFLFHVSGWSFAEVARHQGTCEETARRDFVLARAWLRLEMGG